MPKFISVTVFGPSGTTTYKESSKQSTCAAFTSGFSGDEAFVVDIHCMNNS